VKTQDARWLRIRDLFEQAMDLSPTERETFLDQHCGEDESLRKELRSLLASDEKQTGGALTGAIGAAADATTRARRKELIGSVIGPYRLTSVLGHGGAGTVYLAERIDRQYSAQVAVKVVEGAALNAEISRRFRAERQILANLNHPNIARLIDAGETPEGFPYLVMEYVHGEPISDYCDRMKLSLEDRIQLLLRVCSAVQYAHQNLIVHRDIKPANILVTPDGAPKLLDFGIAKLLDTDAIASEMALTRMNDRVLTPEYASPEQILGQPVTTASDVYALGIVLYELLTGLRPYKVSSASQLELERTICVVEPFKPSVAVKQSVARKAKTPPTIAITTLHGASTRDIHEIVEARRLSPYKLAAKLGGDLDAILMRALRKEPIYRYTSVEQFAADLRRHLAREPVLARQGNWFYYTRRYARRNAIPVAAVVAFIAVLAGAAINYSIQNKRIAAQRDAAEREKKTSDAVADFMVNVFAASDPFEAQGKDITARELLDKSTRNIHEQLGQEPAVKARLLEAMGITYSRQGQYDLGSSLVEEAVQIREGIEGADNPALVGSLLNLGRVRLDQRNYREAEIPLTRAKSILESTSQTETGEYAIALQRMAALENQRNNNEVALKLYRQALPILKSVYGTRHVVYADGLSSYANVLLWNDDYTGAQGPAREAVAIYAAIYPPTHPERINAEGLLGRIFLNLGNLEEATPLIEGRYYGQKEVFGDTSPRLLSPLTSLIRLRLKQGRLANAEQHAREAIRIVEGSGETRTARTGQTYETLGIVLLQREKFAEAEQALREALNIYKDSLPADHMYVATSEHFLGEALIGQKKLSEAIKILDATLARLHRLNSESWRIARSENTLGFALLLFGRSSEAKTHLERSYKTLTGGRAPIELIELARDRLKLSSSTVADARAIR
jgi:serine/threonine protein kinase/uncharacterized protein (DUF2384 family)